MRRALEAEQGAGAAAADLREDADAALVRLLHLAQAVAPAGAAAVGHAFAGEVGDGEVRLQREVVDPLPLELADDLEDAAAALAHATGDGLQFRVAGEGAGGGDAGLGAMHHGAVGGEAQGAGLNGLPHEAGHVGEFLVVGLDVVRAAGAHHVAAQRAVRDLRGDVHHPRLAVDGVQVLGEGLPLPGDAGRHRRGGDVLDGVEQVQQPVALGGADRGEAHAAVAHDDGRDAVVAGGVEVRVPRDLGVHVGVDVDPAGGDELAGGVDLALAGAHVVADGGDAVAVDADVGGELGHAGAVEDAAVADGDLVHGVSLPSRRRRMRRLCADTSAIWRRARATGASFRRRSRRRSRGRACKRPRRCGIP